MRQCLERALNSCTYDNRGGQVSEACTWAFVSMNAHISQMCRLNSPFFSSALSNKDLIHALSQQMVSTICHEPGCILSWMQRRTGHQRCSAPKSSL